MMIDGDGYGYGWEGEVMKKGSNATKPFRRKYTPEQRFFAKVDKNGPLILETRCWAWMGWTIKTGYSCLWLNGKHVYGHAFSYRFHHQEPVPPGKEIMHLCDNPPCTNPEHLRAVTHRENMLDAKAKNRLGGRGPCLSFEAAQRIRKMRKAGIKIEFIAEAFSVSRRTITTILSGRTHK